MEIIKWIIKPLIRLHKWINRWVWPAVLLIVAVLAVVFGCIEANLRAVLIGLAGVGIAIFNLHNVIKKRKSAKGSEDNSGSLPPASEQADSEW